MWGADDSAAKGLADGLMSKADAEHRNLPREVADQVDADTRFMRRAGPGRNHDAFRAHAFDLVDRHLIVAANLNVGAQFPDVLHQVVGKRIVVVEYENHRRNSQRMATAFTPVELGIVASRWPVTRKPIADLLMLISSSKSEISKSAICNAD